MATITHSPTLTSAQNISDATAARRKADADSESTIIAEANGSYHKVKMRIPG